jgi:hypothetical protein
MLNFILTCTCTCWLTPRGSAGASQGVSVIIGPRHPRRQVPSPSLASWDGHHIPPAASSVADPHPLCFGPPGSASRSINPRYGSEDPHPLRIRAKMSWIRNTDKNCASTSFIYCMCIPKDKHIRDKECHLEHLRCFSREFMKFIWGFISSTVCLVGPVKLTQKSQNL